MPNFCWKRFTGWVQKQTPRLSVSLGSLTLALDANLYKIGRRQTHLLCFIYSDHKSVIKGHRITIAATVGSRWSHKEPLQCAFRLRHTCTGSVNLCHTHSLGHVSRVSGMNLVISFSFFFYTACHWLKAKTRGYGASRTLAMMVNIWNDGMSDILRDHRFSACVWVTVFALWLISALQLVLVVNSFWTHTHTHTLRHMLVVLLDLLVWLCKYWIFSS